MNSAVYKEIIKHICIAQRYSDMAKENYDKRREYYAVKDREIQTTLSLIKHNNINQIRFKEVTEFDQNGNLSRVIYFNIYYFGEILQVSFHNFKYVGKPTKGTKDIKWDEKIGGSRENCHRLNKRFHLNVFESEVVL